MKLSHCPPTERSESVPGSGGHSTITDGPSEEATDLLHLTYPMSTHSLFMKPTFTTTLRLQLLGTALLFLPLFGLQAAEVTLVAPGFNTFPTGATGWRYRLGISEASTPAGAWRTNNFVEDGTWNNGAIPIGYTTAANDWIMYKRPSRSTEFNIQWHWTTNLPPG